ncbi:MAG: trans-sulfuration enzyme family protein [Chthonomonadales bacterium]
MREPGFETLCQHAGEDPSRHLGAVAPPIYQCSLFASPDCDTFVHRAERYPQVYDYTRGANPTTDILQAKIASLERCEAARCFASGDAAVTAAILHCVRSGDHVVAVDTVYGPTRAILGNYLTRFGVTATFVPGMEADDFIRAIQPNTRLIFLESPSTMVFRLQDIRAVAAVAKEQGIITALDNSWCSPYFQNPSEMGVDLVIHSATKYLGGHSDLVAGVIAGPRAHLDAIASREGSLLGSVLDPFAAWLILRGLRTLPLRMERHQSNALVVARFLENHPRIRRVHYPGLPSHPQYELGRRQMRGTSGLMSFELKDGTREAVFSVLDRLRYFRIGVSWGGFESLAIPVRFPPGTPARDADADRERWGARIHVGLETVEDLLDDLEQALAAG